MICAAESGVIASKTIPDNTAQRHAWAPHGNNRGDNVDSGTDAAEARNKKGNRPIVRAVAWGKCTRGQRGVRPPAHVRCVAGTVKSVPTQQTKVKQQTAKGCKPEAEGVQARKRHVSRANHQWHEVVGKAEQDGHGHKEDHGRAVHGEHTVEYLRGDKIIVRAHQLDTDDGRFNAADDEKEEGVEDVQNPKPLVINCGRPLMQRLNPWPTRGFRGLNGYDIR
jgi:hypothetical protein